MAAARRHYKRGEKPCEACAAAVREQAAKRRPPPTPRAVILTCTAEGCGKPHRARGLCASHYSQRYQPNRHRKVEVPCAHCGQPTLKPPTTKYAARYCDVKCLALAVIEANRQRRMPILHPNPDPVTHLPARHPARQPKPKRTDWWTTIVAGSCRRCGSTFLALVSNTDTLATYCSLSCLRSDAKARRRALKRDAYVADVRRSDIFSRDKWRCQLCRKKVDRTKVVPHPKAPTIDHIIPLALGGTHEPANCQTACFMCNCLKAHTGTGDQLRLIG